MSRIDDLLRSYCPNGVPHVELGEILDYEQPTKFLVETTDYDDEYQVPVLTAGKSFILGYTNEENGIYPASGTTPVMIFDDFTTAFRWVDFPFKAKSSAMKMLTLRQGVDASFRFVWYAMQCIGFKPSEHSRHWISVYSKFRIPLPPIEVQREVVRVLDLFQSLEAELEARRRQYAHYRDSLLDFSERGGVRWMTLGEVGELVRGNGMPKSDFVDEGVGCIHYGQIYTRFGTSTTQTISFVQPEKAAKLAQVEPGDVIITNTSENLDDVCKAVAWLGDSTIVTGGHATVLKHQENSMYLAYYFQTRHFQVEKNRHATGTKVIDVSAKSLAKIRIPVPSLDHQQEIVGILDKFDALVNDISVGLPAELAARRSQYEYYRNRLLTFEEAA
jgi:type I restriction enzyme S subunit